MRHLVAILFVTLPLLMSPRAWGDAREADARVLVNRAQVAVVWREDRRPYSLWLLRLTPEELVARSSPAATAEFTWTAKSRKVRAVRLANGETFAIHPKSRQFSRYDEVSGVYVEDGAALGEEQGPKTLTEIAEGSGATPEEAIKDALRCAVRLAIGVVVDDEVVVQKEDVISDKVLTYSDGFISSYEELSRKRDKGLVHVKISARIEHRKLLANLRKADINLSTVEGKDLVANAVSRKEARESATALLSKKLAELPNLIDVQVRPPGALDYDAGKQVLALVADVRVNHDKYRDYLESFVPLADKIALAKTRLVLQVQPTFGIGDHLLDWSRGTLGRPLRFGPDLRQIPRSWCLWVVCRCDQHVHTARFTAYALDADVVESLRPLQGTLQARIQLLDGSGGLIHEDVFDPTAGMQRSAFCLGWVAGRSRAFPPLEKPAPENPPLEKRVLEGVLERAPLEKPADNVVSLFAAHQRNFAVDNDNTINAYLAPVFVAGMQDGNIVYARGMWQARMIKIAPQDLKRMKEIRASVELKPAPAAPGRKKP
jgi:hypothetical protein